MSDDAPKTYKRRYTPEALERIRQGARNRWKQRAAEGAAKSDDAKPKSDAKPTPALKTSKPKPPPRAKPVKVKPGAIGAKALRAQVAALRELIEAAQVAAAQLEAVANVLDDLAATTGHAFK